MSSSADSPTAFSRQVAIAVAIAALTVVAGLLVWRLAGVLIVLFAAALFGLGLDALSSWIQRRTMLPRWAAMLLWILLFLGLLVAFLWFVASSLAAQFADLFDRLPRAVESLRDWVSQYSFLRPVAEDIESILGDGTGAGPDARTYIGSALDASRFTLGTLGNLLATTVLAVYMALDWRRYAAGIVRLAPPAWRDTTAQLLDAWRHALPWWLAARLTSMSIVAVLVSIGLAITGVPLPLVLGLIAGLFSFVPFLGPIASVVPAALVAITESATTLLYVLIVFGIVQFLESYFITPLVERHTVSIPLFPLIAAQLIAAALLGIPGVMFATPMLLALVIAIQVVYLRRILGEDVDVWGVH